MMMMSFSDQVTVHITSGSGGNGAIAWRREKFVAYGGPAGGDGGRGGSVYVVGNPQRQTLIDYRFKHHFEAANGAKGENKNCHGRGAKDLELEVPLGTVIRDAETGLAIADITEAGQRVLVAQGGRGGRGNTRFSNSRNKVPFYAEPGESGVQRVLIFELKLIADVGIIGLPNAGKSTFISVVSAAKPKIAAYPFTTLVPNLGVVRKPMEQGGDGIVLADIPGLIEGASQGVGLGHAFLRHVERCRVLVHLVDATATDGGTPWDNYQVIQAELGLYSDHLPHKPQLVVLSKSDALAPEELAELVATFKAKTGVEQVRVISSVQRQGTDALVQELLALIDSLPAERYSEAVVEDAKATANDDSAFEIRLLDDNIWEIDGGKIHRWLAVTDLNTPLSLRRFWIVLKALGVFKALNKAGAKAGDTIYIGDEDFEYDPDMGTAGSNPTTEEEALQLVEDDDFYFIDEGELTEAEEPS
ncbi:MAG: GTPase ObgE [Vampirovibrionales bacterium]